MVQNPILRGFHPDPSLLRVGDDYYLATSTFEWAPGVRIYHSTDLKHWDYVTSPWTITPGWTFGASRLPTASGLPA